MTQYSFEKASKAHAAGDIYVGVPVVQDVETYKFNNDVVVVDSCSSKSVPSPDEDSNLYYAFIAFSIGVFLAFFGWIANVGWIILSFTIFGPLTCQTLFKHTVFSLVGCFFSVVALAAISEMIFGPKEEETPVEEDISHELEGICELGLVGGYLYIGSHVWLTQLLYKPFHIELNDPPSSTTFYAVFIFWMFLWMIETKVVAYTRAVKRANNNDNKQAKIGKEKCFEVAQIV